MPINKALIHETWFPFAILLSLIFIIFFNLNALTIQKAGMIITSIFQKLSLIIPVMAGLLFFGELGTTAKYIGIPLTIVAIVMSNFPHRNSDQSMAAIRKYWYLPILVFAGSGLIEFLLFYIQKTGKVSNDGLNFTSILFFLAGCLGLIFLLIRNKFNFTRNEIIAGICIGIPNFFTIYLLIKGLEVGWEASVLFPVNNVGTIFFTAILGILVFKEKLSNLNYLGLILAIISVYLISQ